MKKAIWETYPPLYLKYSNGKYMVLCNPVKEQYISSHVDELTEELFERIINVYSVWYEELELPLVTEALLKEDTNAADRLVLMEIIKMYDKSSAVNEFTINGIPVWLDKNTRSGLKLRFESEIALGKTDTTLWYEGVSFNLSLELVMQMLYAIEVYASLCYDVTQQHLANVQKLNKNFCDYDYRANYPEKLKF